MPMSWGKKTNSPSSSANGYDDPQICGKKMCFPICRSANLLRPYYGHKMIGCHDQKTNFPSSVTRQMMAVFCGQNG